MRFSGPGPGPMYPGPFHDGHGAVSVLSVVFHFVIAAAIIAAVVYIAIRLLRHLATPRHRAPLVSPAVTELELRYARGEIDRADYLARRADLTGMYSAPPAPPPPATT